MGRLSSSVHSSRTDECPSFTGLTIACMKNEKRGVQSFPSYRNDKSVCVCGNNSYLDLFYHYTSSHCPL